ncbi:hypothetical protein BJY00DRAFT_315440 [Aspergillus carlsbadensis]|nr:hypothetical protein BJY00DRAFT_315440 [Aspergillus carlsbadensis]
MANINFMTIIDRLGSSKPGAKEEADKAMKDLEDQRGRKMRFSPFLLLEVPVKKLCSLDDIEEHNFIIGAPPDIPKLEWPQTPVGKRLVKQVSGSVYLRVDSNGKRTIVDSMNKPITHSQYYPDHDFNTETKLKTRTLAMLETWREELLSNYGAWQDDFAEWRKKRVRWELDLVNRMNDMKIITSLKEYLTDLERTKRYLGAADEFIPMLDELEYIPTDHSTWIAVIDGLGDSVALLRKHLQEMEGEAPPEERLLVCFRDEDEHEEPQKAAITTPEHYQMQQLYHWCLERHANRAEEGAFTKRTCHYHYQLGTLADLTTTAPKY